eukprot:scaffold436_cov267-Pinguiococcus_pyrenoidosus.AAC.21
MSGLLIVIGALPSMKVLAIVCNFAGFWVIYVHVGDLRLDDFHSFAGFVIFIAANVQALIGAVRPSRPSRAGDAAWVARRITLLYHPQAFHKSTGLLLVIIAHVNVAAGLDERSVKDGDDYTVSLTSPVALIPCYRLLTDASRLVYLRS